MQSITPNQHMFINLVIKANSMHSNLAKKIYLANWN